MASILADRKLAEVLRPMDPSDAVMPWDPPELGGERYLGFQPNVWISFFLFFYLLDLENF